MPFLSTFSDVFKNWDFLRFCAFSAKKSFPQSYPHFIHNLPKLSTISSTYPHFTVKLSTFFKSYPQFIELYKYSYSIIAIFPQLALDILEC